MAQGNRRLRRPVQHAAEICRVDELEGARLATGRAAEGLITGSGEETEGGSGGNIYVHGSLSVAQELLRHGLVDRIRLLSYPGAVGQRKKLFPPGEQLPLELISATQFSNGVVALEYAPVTAKS
jgi:dihydrofolate reductase